MKLPVDERLLPLVDALDRIGFNVGSSRVAIYTALITTLVVVSVIVFGRIASHIARRVFARKGEWGAHGSAGSLRG